MITTIAIGLSMLFLGTFIGYKVPKNKNNLSNNSEELTALKDIIKQKESSLKHILNIMIQSAESYTNIGVKSIYVISEDCSESASTVSADLNKISSIIAGQSDNIQKIQLATTTTQESVFTGNKNIQEVKTTLDSFLGTQETLKSIDNQLSEIHEQSLEIEKIGKEAEMLALNAAIESARAGDVGRGFAVVADNMKILAKNSQSTSIQIANTLSSNRKNIASIVDQVQNETSTLNNQLEGLFCAFTSIDENINDIRNQVADLEKESINGNALTDQLSQTTRTSMENIIHKLVELSGQINGKKVKNITPQEVRDNLTQFDEIIDVRRADEFNDELGHIKNAKLITLQTDLKGALKDFDPKKCYLFVCRSGGRSAKGAQLAISHGVDNVFNMTGGMLKWK